MSTDQIKEFLERSQPIEFTGQSRKQVYGWVRLVLAAQEYAGRGKKERGAVRDYIAKVTALSLAQVTRRCTGGDIALLAEVDRAHERLSGPASTPKRCRSSTRRT